MNSFHKKPIVTYGLIAVNLLVFIGMTLSGGTQNAVNLIAWGAKYNPLIIQGELWRLFTPMFIHIGLEHLALNLLTLYFLGVQLEQLFGKWRFFSLIFNKWRGRQHLEFCTLKQHFSGGKYFAVWAFWRLFDARRII